jgi:ElaB/YqjD/DUF883 family membrane-anchored ribosome-binding protein
METTLKQAAATATDPGKDVKDSVMEFGKSAGRKIDSAREQAGDALHAAASSLRKGSARIDVLAAGAAQRLDATASMVEDTDLKGLGAGVRRFAKNHLTLTLLVAVAAGFWAASTLSRATRAE